MKKLILILPLIFLLGCTTTPPSPAATEVVYCTPPPEFMEKSGKLPQIQTHNNKITLKELIDIWIDDIGRYNKLKNKDDSLIDWIKTHCQQEENG